MSAPVKIGEVGDAGEAKDPTAILLRSFRLPTMAGHYEEVMQRAEKEGWSHRKALRHLCESEAVDRGPRRTARLLSGSGLPESKTLSSLDDGKLPAKMRRQLPALIEGGFVDRATNVIVFGLPSRGKTHVLAALGRELILSHSKRVLLRPAFKIVGQLLTAKELLFSPAVPRRPSVGVRGGAVRHRHIRPSPSTIRSGIGRGCFGTE
jgi:DNA replication protein DnaC